jgi:hypothetical protein
MLQPQLSMPRPFVATRCMLLGATGSLCGCSWASLLPCTRAGPRTALICDVTCADARATYAAASSCSSLRASRTTRICATPRHAARIAARAMRVIHEAVTVDGLIPCCCTCCCGEQAEQAEPLHGTRPRRAPQAGLTHLEQGRGQRVRVPRREPPQLGHQRPPGLDHRGQPAGGGGARAYPLTPNPGAKPPHRAADARLGPHAPSARQAGLSSCGGGGRTTKAQGGAGCPGRTPWMAAGQSRCGVHVRVRAALTCPRQRVAR